MRTQTVQQARNQVSPKVLSGAPTTAAITTRAMRVSPVHGRDAVHIDGLAERIDGRTFIIENPDRDRDNRANRRRRCGQPLLPALGECRLPPASRSRHVNQRWRIASWVIP
jgi:hypothetical protein